MLQGKSKKKAAAALTGLATGFFGGLLGMGGAFISIPAMMSFLGMGRHRAHATSLAVITLMSALAATFYGLAGNIDARLAAMIFAGSSVGVVAGARMMHRMPVRELGIFFGGFIVVIAVKMVIDAAVLPWTPYHGPMSGLLIVFAGVASGYLSGLLGLGGAVIIIPALVYLAGTTQQVAQGTVLLALIPTAAIGTFTHWRNGYIDLPAASWMGAGALVSCLAGAYLANILPSSSLKGIFSAVILIVGVHTLATSLKPPDKSRSAAAKK